MTFVDTADLRARTCPHCGAVIGDQLAHARYHRAVDAVVESIEHVRNILLGVEEEVDHLRRRS